MLEENRKGGLHHNFFLVETDNYFPDKSRKNRLIDLDEIWENYKCVNMHDDHLRYLSDTLIWIPTYNSWKNRDELGIYFYSTTIIKKNGAIIAKKIFENWANLFLNGTENFELTGSYCSNSENHEKGYYNKIKINRDEFVEKLNTLSYYCDEVIKSNDKKSIWHFGI